MRTRLLLFLLVLVLVVSSRMPRWFEAPAPVPPVALAEEDEDDDDDGDRRSRYVRQRGPDGYGSEAGAAGSYGLALARGPYLQLATPDGITIRWLTSAPAPSLVRYGRAPGDLRLRVEEQAPTMEHELRLTSLSPDTRYYYSVGTPAAALAEGPECAFRTSPPAGSERRVRVWMIGDSGLRGAAQQRVQQAYDAHSGGAETDVWLLLGDNAYDAGTGPQYQAGFFEPYRSRLRSTVVWPSRGNHDRPRQGPGNDYYDFFTLPTRGEAGGTPSGTEHWYSFDFANVHFVCLDAERLGGARENAMLDWLRTDLEATQQDWVIAYWHHPPYSKGSHDSDQDEVMSGARSRLLPVLEEGGADLVAGGHSHSYERSYLLSGHYGPSGSLRPAMILDRGDGRPDGDGPYRKPAFGRPAPHEGTVYVVVGSSSKLSGGRLDHRVHARSLNVLGSLAVDVSGQRLDAAFVDAQGRVADRFAIVKGADSPSLRGSRTARPRDGNAAHAPLPGTPTGRRTRP